MKLLAELIAIAALVLVLVGGLLFEIDREATQIQRAIFISIQR